MGALIELREHSLAEPLPPGIRGGYVDLPKAGTTIEARGVDLVGWVLGDEPPRGVELVSEGRTLARVPLGVERPDLAAAFPDAPHAGRAGFRAGLALPGRRRELELTVVALLRDGRRETVARLRGLRRWRASRGPERDLVSVVIPCHGQAHYLGDAIESALAQTHPHVEVVVVDDGSQDNTAAVVARYEGVRLVRQANEGLAAARNAGIRSSNGDYLVFLDADDLLLPHGVELNLAALRDAPEAAFAAGVYRYVDGAGEPLPSPAQDRGDGNAYAAFLRTNAAGAIHAVLFRRAVFELVRGFDGSVDACADYELYLRITRDHHAVLHDREVALYRRHAEAMSRANRLMLDQVTRIHRAQRRHVRGDLELEAAYAEGSAFWRLYYDGGRRPAHLRLARGLRGLLPLRPVG